VEYVIFTGLVIIIMIASTYYIYKDYSTQIYSKEARSLRDLGKSIQSELFIAADMNDGYFRIVTLPNRTHDFFRFDISCYPYEVVLNGTRVGDIGFTTPIFSGSFQKGVRNYIAKQNGTITVTQ
jgi:hypothetical protein